MDWKYETNKWTCFTKKGNETKYSSGQIAIFSSKSYIGNSKPHWTRFPSIQSKMILLYIYSIMQDPIYFENRFVLVEIPTCGGFSPYQVIPLLWFIQVLRKSEQMYLLMTNIYSLGSLNLHILFKRGNL